MSIGSAAVTKAVTAPKVLRYRWLPALNGAPFVFLAAEGIYMLAATEHGEVTYMVPSLSAKSLLAWLIFANVLRT